MRSLVILAFVMSALMSGCGNRVYPGNNWVIVDVDADLDKDMRDEIRVGVRYWDDVGGHFRTLDQLDPAEALAILKHAEHLPMHKGTECGPYILDPGPPPYPASVAGCYRGAEGDVVINSYFLVYEIEKGRQNSTDLSSIVAHEVGHSMGLRHINPPYTGYNNCEAVMQPGCAFPAITDFDRGEYESIW